MPGPTQSITKHDAAGGREDFDARVSGIATLGEPVRRALYRHVVAQPSPVNRDQAAEGVGVARHVAKFHLDKLVDDELLEVEFRRPPGRGGPGAGRPPKLYRRSSRELEVSLPDRRYDLAGRLLARGVSLANCPFHALAADYTELVCSMNRELLAGILAGLGHRGLDARLDPAPGMCCVRLRSHPPRRSDDAGGDG